MKISNVKMLPISSSNSNWKLATLALATLATMATSAKTFDVDISTGRPAASNEAYYHGETIEFRAVRGRTAVTNIEYGCIYYQTNGMADVWWTTDGLTFHPTNDVGAASYRFFLEGRDEVGRDWHANGLLRLLPSPGFTPNEIELPVKSLDFANVEVANAPYYTKTETDSRIVELSPTPGDYETVSNRASNARSKTDLAVYTMADWHPRYSVESGFFWDGELGVWVGRNGSGFEGYTLSYSETEKCWLYDNGSYTRRIPGSWDDLTLNIGTEITRPSVLVAADDALAKTSQMAQAAQAATNYTDEAVASIPAPDLTDYATHDDATNAARAVSAPLEENVGVLWQYVLGDTVWFAVTNYMRTVEGVVPSLQLWEVRDGATNLVYHSTEEVSNFVASASAELRTEITNAMPSKAWSRYQSATGAENPQPGDITIVSTPSIMMTGGGEWNRYVHVGGSSVWVLRSNGLTTFGGGADGSFFAVQDDEGNTQFEVRRTDSYEVDALPSATGFSGDDFQVTYNLTASSNPPTLYATTNLATVAFAPEVDGQIDSLGVTVSWASSDGLWRATIVQDVKAPALFVHAKALQEGSIVVRNNAPTALSGGIYIGNTKYTVGTAVINGHTVLTLTPAP